MTGMTVTRAPFLTAVDAATIDIVVRAADPGMLGWLLAYGEITSIKLHADDESLRIHKDAPIGLARVRADLMIKADQGQWHGIRVTIGGYEDGSIHDLRIHAPYLMALPASDRIEPSPFVPFEEQDTVVYEPSLKDRLLALFGRTVPVAC